MTTTELFLIRHGESEGNVAAAAADRDRLDVVPVSVRDPDVPLSPLGVEQSRALADWLRRESEAVWPDRVWCSPYVRAQQTAAIAFSPHGVGAESPDAAGAGSEWRPVVDERLRDREFGILDTLTSRGIEARFPEEAARRRRCGKFYYRPPGGESWADLALRIRSFLAELDRDDSPRRVAVVCHDAVVFLFRYVCEGLSEPEVIDLARATLVTNTGVTQLVRERGERGWAVRLFNSAAHLEPRNPRATGPEGDRDDR